MEFPSAKAATIWQRFAVLRRFIVLLSQVTTYIVLDRSSKVEQKIRMRPKNLPSTKELPIRRNWTLGAPIIWFFGMPIL